MCGSDNLFGKCKRTLGMWNRLIIFPPFEKHLALDRLALEFFHNVTLSEQAGRDYKRKKK